MNKGFYVCPRTNIDIFTYNPNIAANAQQSDCKHNIFNNGLNRRANAVSAYEL